MENTHRVFFMLLLFGSIHTLTATGISDYDTAQHRGDIDDSPSQAVGATGLGFSGIEQRHDGYVKGETPTIPKTSFTCSAQPFNPGLYADMETQCQVYHVCFGDRQESFLCGPGTNFNQKILACDFWYNFNCQESPSFYDANADIGKIPDPYRPTGEQSISRDRTKITQQPVYPEFPRDGQKPIVTDDGYDRPRPPAIPPPRVSVPPPPPRVSVHPPPPRVFVPPPPPRVPSHQPPRIHLDPPRIQPLPPKVSLPPPRVSDPPRIQEPAQPPIRFQPPPKVRPPPAIQQQVDTEYDFENSKPSRPSLPPPPPLRPALPPSFPPPRPVLTTAKPVFPPVVSPPRISRPPLTPPVVVLPPPAQPSRPVTPVRPQFPSGLDHPDSNIKGSTGYRPRDPPRIPQPSRPIDNTYPSYPPPRPVAPRPVSRPSSRPVQQEHVEVDYVPLPPRQQPPPPPPPPIHQEVIHTERVPPPPRRPPATIQTEYIPPPPPPRRPPATIQTEYVPPPPPRRPPASIKAEYVPLPPPRQPPFIVQQEEYVPPPRPQRPSDDYRPVLPPVSPSVISVQQRPQGPPARPSVVVSVGPQQPRPVFPPASDHPNANIKGGPGYQQPPPQPPVFDPKRIDTRPVTVPRQPPPDSSRTHTSRVKTPDRVKEPSQTIDHGYEPPRVSVSVPLPPPPPPPRPQTPTFPPPRPQTIDHPSANIKGGSVVIVPQPPRIQVSTSPVGIKRPESSIGYEVPIPSLPSRPLTGIKTASKTPGGEYKPPLPYPPAITVSRVKVPSQPVIQQVRPQFPAPRPQPIDHPNANVKGGPGYQPPRPQQPVRVPHAPPPVISQPPFSPSTSQRRKVPPEQDTTTGRGFQTSPKRPDYPKVDVVYPPAVEQEVYEHQRKPLPPAIPPPPRDPVSSVKQSTSIKQAQRGPPSTPHRVSVKTKQPQSDYNIGSSYRRGSETYPKPEFQQPAYPSGPYQPPIVTPPRSSDLSKKRPVTQITTSHDTRSQFPAFPVASVPRQTTHSRQPAGSHPAVAPADYPFREIPGHQPPHQRQVFPHRDNPDHPNESLKGSGAYRPPPPADFQPSGSEIVQQEVAGSEIVQQVAGSEIVQQKATSDDSEKELSKLGDTGTE